MLNNSVLLLLWEKCIDEFMLGSNAAGVAKSLLICGMTELFLFDKLVWLCNILAVGELAWELDSDCTSASKFSCNKHSFVMF